MSNETINKNLKILAIITLIILIAYTLIQIGSYFMDLVTILGISIILTYILLVPVNNLENLLNKGTSKIITVKEPVNKIHIAHKEIVIPEMVAQIVNKSLLLAKKFLPFLHKRVLSILTVYIAFLLIVGFIAFQLIPPAIYQVTEFARNIPSYAESAINYVSENFPEIEIPGLSGVMREEILQTSPDQQELPIIIHETDPQGEITSFVQKSEAPDIQPALPQKRIGKDELKTIVTETATKFKDNISDFIQNNATDAINNVINVAAGTLTGIGYTVTILVLSFYFLLDGRSIIEAFNKMIPENIRNNVIELEKNIHFSLLGFLKGQVFLGFVTGGFMLIVYVAAGIKYSIFLSLFLAVAEIIPVVGTYLGFIPALIVMLFTESLPKVFIIWFIFFLYQTVKDNIVAPKIVGEIIGLHPVTVIFALWIGFKLAGFFGILFAIPVASVLSVTVNFILCKKSEKQDSECEPV